MLTSILSALGGLLGMSLFWGLAWWVWRLPLAVTQPPVSLTGGRPGFNEVTDPSNPSLEPSSSFEAPGAIIEDIVQPVERHPSSGANTQFFSRDQVDELARAEPTPEKTEILPDNNLLDQYLGQTEQAQRAPPPAALTRPPPPRRGPPPPPPPPGTRKRANQRATLMYGGPPPLKPKS